MKNEVLQVNKSLSVAMDYDNDPDILEERTVTIHYTDQELVEEYMKSEGGSECPYRHIPLDQDEAKKLYKWLHEFFGEVGGAFSKENT